MYNYLNDNNSIFYKFKCTNTKVTEYISKYAIG